ncbi:hypothetical protein M8J75_010944 [Diaphorina citri]|nr:hypothetical protein M8J75_010944 [Diaphorina citri]
MDPFEHNFDKPIGSQENLSQKVADGKHAEDINDFFSHKPSKIIDTIDFLNAETGRGQQEVTSGLVDLADSVAAGAGDLSELVDTHTKHAEQLVDDLDDKVHAEVTSGLDKVHTDVTSGLDKISDHAHEKIEEFGKKFEDNDLLGLSHSNTSHKEPSLEPVKPEHTHVSDHVKDLLFDEKEQDELKGFDQYTSDSNASLKVNLSCENDDTASTKSIDSAQSIPLDEKKNLAKENLIEDASEVLSKISEDTLINTSKFSSPSPKESKSFVDHFESDFISQEAPPVDHFHHEAPPTVEPKPSPPKHEEVKTEKEVPKVKEEKVTKVETPKEEKVSKAETVKVKAPPVKKAPSTEMFIGPHEVFSRFGLDTWFNPEKLNPKGKELQPISF